VPFAKQTRHQLKWLCCLEIIALDQSELPISNK
jgi:hypothetical protein